MEWGNRRVCWGNPPLPSGHQSGTQCTGYSSGPEKTEKSVITANVEVEANRFGSVYSVTISLRQCGKRMYKVLHGMVHYFKLRVPPYISRYFIAVTELNKMLLYFFLHALLGWRWVHWTGGSPHWTGSQSTPEREQVNASSHRLAYKGIVVHTPRLNWMYIVLNKESNRYWPIVHTYRCMHIIVICTLYCKC